MRIIWKVRLLWSVNFWREIYPVYPIRKMWSTISCVHMWITCFHMCSHVNTCDEMLAHVSTCFYTCLSCDNMFENWKWRVSHVITHVMSFTKHVFTCEPHVFTCEHTCFFHMFSHVSNMCFSCALSVRDMVQGQRVKLCGDDTLIWVYAMRWH